MQTGSRFEEAADSSVQADIQLSELEVASKLEEVCMAHLQTRQKCPFSSFSALSPVLSLAEIPSSALVAKKVEAEDHPKSSQNFETNPISYSAGSEGLA